MRVLLDEATISGGVRRLAAELNEHFGDRPWTLIGVMSGSVVFLADLMRLLPGRLRVGLVQARSYRGDATSPGELALDLDSIPAVRGRHVLLIDDIFDTGRTLSTLVDRLAREEPASLRTAVLLYKKERAEVDYRPDYVVFRVPNEFVVGYGLDHDDAYRNLPFIAALEPDEQGAEASVETREN